MRSLAKHLAVIAASLGAATPAAAAALKPMNLEELTRKAGRIFTGTVVAVEKGSVAAGGGTLPTVTYRVAVERPLAGVPAKSAPITEIRMIGDLDEVRRDGRVRFRRMAPRPAIEAGARYLFFLTTPGPAGLSTTVGLGQGCFRLTGDAEDADAVNEFDNAGLFRGMAGERPRTRGPVKLATLVDRIAALRGRR